MKEFAHPDQKQKAHADRTWRNSVDIITGGERVASVCRRFQWQEPA
jgi:hypothetical protein